MKIHIVYHVDDDAPTDMLIEGDDPAELYQTAKNALSAMEWACLDRIRARLTKEFKPDPRDARVNE